MIYRSFSAIRWYLRVNVANFCLRKFYLSSLTRSGRLVKARAKSALSGLVTDVLHRQ